VDFSDLLQKADGEAMKRILVAVMVLPLMLFSTMVLAEDVKEMTKVVAGELHKPHGFEFGLMYYHFDYEEDIPPPGKSTEEGWLPGLYLGCAYNKKKDLYTKVFVEFSTWDVEYDGTTLGGTPIRFSDNPQDFFRLEWDIGYTFDAGKGFSLAPYVGYGYRYWERGKAKITSTYWTYREVYTWHYIPVGIKADFQVDNKWSIGANVAARFMFGGEMTACFSEVSSNLSDLTFDLGNEAGWFAEMPICYKFSADWSLVGTPWHEYSEIGESNVVGGFYEPASTTHQYGINVGLICSF